MNAAQRIVELALARDRVWGGYAHDLLLEGLLEWSEASGEAAGREHVAAVMERRGLSPGSPWPWERQPFCHLNHALARYQRERAWTREFIAQSRRLFREVPRDADGLIEHRRGDGTGGLLIDMLGDYAARMARTGALTGEAAFFEECASQVCGYEAVLRDPATGLWSQGRGWIAGEPETLAPGAWSRGQGWVMRGLSLGLEALAPDSPPFGRVHAVFSRLAGALLARQGQDGLWHQLPHLPEAESFPESSGSAFIAAALRLGVRHGWLECSRFLAPAERALGRLPGCVRADGVVTGCCEGPGPLESIQPYRRQPAPDDEPHGAPALLLAFAEGARAF